MVMMMVIRHSLNGAEAVRTVHSNSSYDLSILSPFISQCVEGITKAQLSLSKVL